MIDLDAADLIDSLSTGDYTVTRRATVSYVNGIAVPASPSTLTITAAVYQASGRDLLRLPEERRSIETRIVFTATRLYVGAQQGQGSEAANVADMISIGGTAFEVQTVETWPGAVGFYRCIVQAVG